MTHSLELEHLKNENQKLRNYISLITGEVELTQRIIEIRENFQNHDDSEHLILPLYDRLARIHYEKLLLQKELNLD